MSRPEYDYEKQYQDDLEKATALSMETLALDQFRRTKQYPHLSTTKTFNSVVQASRSRPGSLTGTIAPPPTIPPRRHSEIRLTSDSLQADSDLISFTSPTSSMVKKDETNPNLTKLIEDIQKLNTQIVQPPQTIPSYNSYGYGSSLQLVPYQQQPPPQKAPLTSEQLQKLYSMPSSHNMASQPYTQPYAQQHSLPASYNYPPAPPYGFQMHVMPRYHNPPPAAIAVNPETALVAAQNHKLYQMPKSASISGGVSSIAHDPGSNVSRHSSPSTSSEAEVHRRLRKPMSMTGGGVGEAGPTAQSGLDLIDLGHDDNSRVSVLEAFDPLLTHDDEYGSDNASDCTTSYYAESDPFDYLYSCGTQYSDPVYEAVIKQDRTPISPAGGAPIGWKTDLPSPTASSSTPPPLPPRNSGGSTNDRSFPNHVLDRRKNLTRLYEMVTDRKTIDPELMEFYHIVKDLRSEYKYDDPAGNVGHVIASEFNYCYPMATSIKILVHPSLDALRRDCEATKQGLVGGYGAPIVFTSDIHSPVELVIGHVFCALEGQITGTVDDYAAKPIGVAEWLAPSSKLSQLECVHDSLKLEKDVQLGLCLKTEANMKVIARTHRDDVRDCDLKPEDVLPNETAETITYDSMMILIETLETEIDKLESATSDSNSHAIISCSGVVQGVKAICALLGHIDTLEMVKCIDDLKKICATGQAVFTPYGTNPDIVAECGDYAEVALRPKSTVDKIKMKCNQIREAMQELIEIYANAFRVDFCVKTLDYSISPVSVSSVLKPIMVNISCLHRPPPQWKFDEYVLGAQISYGTRNQGEAMVIRCSNEMSGGIFPRLKFDSWIYFDKSPICTLPRESRLIFVLYGMGPAETEQNSDNGQERKQISTELGWCAIQLFDFQREMICGQYLLSIWPPTTDKFLGPAPAKGCHPNSQTCPVLSIEIPVYGGRIQFPEPLENPPQAPRYDFTSLDSNLQQELLDTAEQGYSGALMDKREVFWEKRHYLQNFPHALPKVLHAAHSWDYASLMDLHALLNSWYPLSPLQALELLLPRYPDAKVRAKACEWIAKMPNDHLVDFLPQLLQALKHDTYEASPMARLLLSKSLESPRIAHHLYWLLVHSLPGDSPQNTIDASSAEYDEALITQARYHRRNKMMLRALLAICGEKLLSRFLSQNMMCKNLAEVAQSVKSAKESLRQKTLFHGLEAVHHALIDAPTSLPLGPGLEVSGVSVRNCSYFNSNTLPLKVAFLGPDKGIQHAIFKAGDDLQQDMLTIQLVRVMNKLWLAEGLDLKIVTFDCVPTGYKKGMIEMVSDAETLRKIQVEYGLTGSFKDRPIAEWLAKQNPSQLEYQRAVANFTVSCAGYSVATYILGICDRHNDNIMLKTSGHLFHIDFGKFLGDAQMFGNFKRDRTPFVLTSDMAYVINGGDKPSTEFHYFVDLCCRAFNIVRKHGDLILQMLALMATAGIPGVTADAVKYVQTALLPSQSNPEAAASFAKMIQFSLKNWFTQFNFFLHNIAQMRFSSEEGSGELLSFVPRKYTLQQDGKLKSVTVHGYQKRYDMEKYYTYILKVARHGQPDPAYLFRSYKEFCEFHQKLCLHFPLAKLHSLPSGMHVGRSNIKSVADRRLPEIRAFLESLFNSAAEIAHSDLVYTFFHPLLRDQQEANIHVSKVKGKDLQPIAPPSEKICGEVKLSLQYRRGALTVMIHHVRGLPTLTGGQEPNTYVKCYLKPDPTKETKRKTKVVRKTCVPSFMETLEYRMPLQYIQTRSLHVTVWSHDTLQENELLGGFQLDLSSINLKEELIEWYRLGYMPRS